MGPNPDFKISPRCLSSCQVPCDNDDDSEGARPNVTSALRSCPANVPPQILAVQCDALAFNALQMSENLVAVALVAQPAPRGATLETRVASVASVASGWENLLTGTCHAFAKVLIAIASICPEVPQMTAREVGEYGDQESTTCAHRTLDVHQPMLVVNTSVKSILCRPALQG